jgi:ornithine cyclodeaminase/alanine dehydrogenase-like protein (mu-crystallin family)
LKSADKIVIDDYEIAMDTKEIKIPIEQGILTEKNIYGTIGEIVGGIKPGRKTSSEITIYKSVGTTIPYVTINAMIYEKAIEMDLGKQVDKSSLDLIYTR